MTMATTRIKRNDAIRMKVAPDVLERLDRISRVYGMPPSTLAAMALGQWVTQQERTLLMTEAMAQSVGQHLGESVATELREQLSLLAKGADDGKS